MENPLCQNLDLKKQGLRKMKKFLFILLFFNTISIAVGANFQNTFDKISRTVVNEKTALSLRKELSDCVSSLILEGNLEDIQQLFRLYMHKTNDEPDLEFLKFADTTLFYIKTKLINKDFNFKSSLNSLRILPERIDGKEILTPGMSPDSPNLTERERQAYKLQLEAQKKYIEEKDKQIELKLYYDAIVFDISRYIERGILLQRFDVKQIKNLNCDYMYNSNMKQIKTIN
jgi:hypothetical protein